MPRLPTMHPPGSAGKLAVLAERVALRQPLWHPDDAPLGSPDATPLLSPPKIHTPAPEADRPRPRGVSWMGSKRLWRVRHTTGARAHVGYFATLDDAIRAALSLSSASAA